MVSLSFLKQENAGFISYYNIIMVNLPLHMLLADFGGTCCAFVAEAITLYMTSKL